MLSNRAKSASLPDRGFELFDGCVIIKLTSKCGDVGLGLYAAYTKFFRLLCYFIEIP